MLAPALGLGLAVAGCGKTNVTPAYSAPNPDGPQGTFEDAAGLTRDTSADSAPLNSDVPTSDAFFAKDSKPIGPDATGDSAPVADTNVPDALVRPDVAQEPDVKMDSSGEAGADLDAGTALDSGPGLDSGTNRDTAINFDTGFVKYGTPVFDAGRDLPDAGRDLGMVVIYMALFPPRGQ